MGTIHIVISDEALADLRRRRSVTLRSGGLRTPASRGNAVRVIARPRRHSVPDQLLRWAARRTRTFTAQDVATAFGLRRQYASLLLGRFAHGPEPIRRRRHGVYEYVSGDGASRQADVARVRTGTLPARILAWARHRATFGLPDVAAAFGISAKHASVVVGKLANGDYPMRRREVGVYEYARRRD